MLNLIGGLVIAVVIILPLVLAFFAKTLHPGVRVFLGAVAVSPYLTWLLLKMAMQTGGWVGAGHVPVPQEVKIAFVPALGCVVGGIVTIIAGVRQGAATVGAGFLALVAGFVEYLGAGLVIALAHIS